MDAVMYDMMMISSMVLLTIFKSSNGVHIQKECGMESSFQQTTDCIIQQTRNFIDEASNNARQNQYDELSEINVLYNVINSVIKDSFSDWVRAQVAIRNEKIKSK